MKTRHARQLVLVALVLLAAAAQGADWPRWRGPEGLGVAPDAGPLPERWSPDGTGIRWRIPIPGDGISSPVVSDGRVFLTTAYRSESLETVDRVLPWVSVALALVIALLIWRVTARALAPEGGVGALFRKPRSGDALAVVVTSLLFLMAAALLALRSEAYLEEGNPGRTWRVTCLVALLGLLAAFSWFRADSRWRTIAAAVLLAAGAAVVYLYPSGPLGPVGLDRRLVAAFPAIVGAVWWLARRRRRRTAAGELRFEALYNPLLGLPLVGLALLVFVPLNFLSGLERVVVCVDLESGELLWQRTALRAPAEQKYPKSTYATPTPAVDGERVFAYFGAGAAAMTLDGRLEWSLRFPGYSQNTRYGAGSSPILTDDHVVIVQESELYQDGPPSWIGAFDKQSGRAAWRITPPEAHDSYTTPILFDAPGERQLLVASWETLMAFDAETGERLWEHPYPMWQMVASLAREGDLLAVTGGAHGEPALMVMRLRPDGSGLDLLWESRRAVATVASPLIYRGLLFTVTDGGIMTCYDAETGEERWKKRLGGNYFASLVAGDGKVYAINSDGETSVLAAEPEFRRLAQNELGAQVYASPAIAGGGLLVRAGGELLFVEGEPRTAASEGGARPQDATVGGQPDRLAD